MWMKMCMQLLAEAVAATLFLCKQQTHTQSHMHFNHSSSRRSSFTIHLEPTAIPSQWVPLNLSIITTVCMMEMNSVATAATSTNIFAQECEQKRRNKQTNFVFYVHEVRQTRENRKYKAKWCNGVDATIERCERKIIVEVKMNVKFDRIKNKDTEKKKKAIQKNRRLPQTNRWISFIQNGRLRPYSGRLDANNLQFRRICVFSYCFRNQYSNALFFFSP